MAEASHPTAHSHARFLDAGEERLNILVPLRGYASQPLVSLRESVVRLRTLLDDLDSRVYTALARSRNPRDNLTQDESAAIVLYTIEWDPDHPSLFSLLNQTLRLEDRSRLRDWFWYLKLFLTALFKLPSIHCIVWRGVRGDLHSDYVRGDRVTWWAFSSCTTSISALLNNQYLGTSGPRTLFLIECLNGKQIRHHSYFETEDEILLLPCTHFEIIDQLSTGNNMHIIHLREIPPPHVLLEVPSVIQVDRPLAFVATYQRKRALIIGINNYHSGRLEYTVNDAEDVQTALQDIGFEASLGINCDYRTFHEMISAFTHQIQHSDLTLFYFAGHGKQYDNTNYLLPSDYHYDHGRHEGDYMTAHAINAQYIIGQIDRQHCRVAVFILDCCTQHIRTRGCDSSGLSPMTTLSESIIVFACGRGGVIVDETRNGRNGPFVESLLKYISTPDIDIEDIFKNVARDVKMATNKLQQSYRISNLTEKVYLLTNNVLN